MRKTRIVVATHGHCFDGMASAALFTHLVRALTPGGVFDLRYRSCGYGPGMSQIPEAWLDGDENAILDFRYTPSKRLTWYFDHHVTGFSSPEEQAAATDGPAGERVFFDPGYGSCTQLITDVARDRFGVTSPDLAELTRWADIIDAARFTSAESATARVEPALQLASVVEHHGDGGFLAEIVPKLLDRPLLDVALDPAIQEKWRPIAAAEAAFTARVQASATEMGRVVLVDLGDAPLDVAAKFIAYALFPRCMYSVTLIRTKQQCKVSVGYNPWCGAARLHDIASICRRYGGGGHPVVGAAAFPLSQLEKAREAARVIAAELDA